MTRNNLRWFTRWYLLLLLLFSFLGWQGGFSEARAQSEKNDVELKNRFLQEAPPRWEEYSRRAKQFQGRCSVQSLLQVAGEEGKSHLTCLWKKNEKCHLVELTTESISGGKTEDQTYKVVGANPTYAFTLRQKSPTSPWTVSQLIDLRKNNLPPAIKSIFDGNEDGVNVLVQTVHGEYLIQLVQQPEFHVVHCRKIGEAGAELVEVAFHCSEDGGKYIQEGTLHFDPHRFWCLHSFEIQTTTVAYRATTKWHVLELGEVGESLPVPRRTIQEGAGVYYNDGKSRKSTSRFEYDFTIPSTLPDDKEFTLSAYGLPEPPGLAGKRPTPWYFWLGLAGLLCLLLGAVFYLLKQRRQRRAGSTP